MPGLDPHDDMSADYERFEKEQLKNLQTEELEDVQ
jgi:hypothetical protein